MERRDAFDFYIDYLLCSPSTATATGLSAVLDNALKHDYMSDCLSQTGLDGKAFWQEPGRRAVELSIFPQVASASFSKSTGLRYCKEE